MKPLSIIFIAAVVLFPFSHAEEQIIAMEFTVTKDGSAQLNQVSVESGAPDQKKAEGDYRLVLLDSAGNELWDTNMRLSFYIHDANIFLDKVTHFQKAPYFPNAKTLHFYKGDSLLLEEELRLCNSDKTCNENENYLSCPSDCPLNKPDGYCVNKGDGVCDPDCVEGFDPDCRPAKPAGNGPSGEQPGGGYAQPPNLIPLLILPAAAVVIIIFLIVRGRKKAGDIDIGSEGL